MATLLDPVSAQGLEDQIIKKTMCPKLLLITFTVLPEFTCIGEPETPEAQVLLA